jgi:hypothetical protein
MKLFALVLTLCVASALAGEQRRLGASIAADPPAATATAAAADPKTKASTDEKSGKVAAAVEKGEKALNGVADKGLALLDSTPGSHLSVAMRAVLMLVFLFFIVQVGGQQRGVGRRRCHVVWEGWCVCVCVCLRNGGVGCRVVSFLRRPPPPPLHPPFSILSMV